MKKVRRRFNNIHQTVYQGISMTDGSQQPAQSLTFSDIKDNVPETMEIKTSFWFITRISLPFNDLHQHGLTAKFKQQTKTACELLFWFYTVCYFTVLFAFNESIGN